MVMSLGLSVLVAPSLAAAAGTPTTSVIIPNNGATLTGTTTLDAAASSNTDSVTFFLAGGVCGYGCAVANASPTQYGWLASWDTTGFSNGSYTLYAEASNSIGNGFSLVSASSSAPTNLRRRA